MFGTELRRLFNMGAIVSFFTVAAAIMILVPLALGMELIAFLNEYMWQASFLFWGIIIIFCILVGRKEKTEHDKWFMFSGWSSLLPVYCFLIGAIKDIMAMRGFEIILAVLLEFPLCFLFCLGGGISISLLAEKIEDPLSEAVVMIIGNILFTMFVTSFGI